MSYIFLFNSPLAQFLDGHLTYNISRNQIITPPVPIDSGINPNTDWVGMATAGFERGVDAAINWGDGRVFFFKDDRYVAYDIYENRVMDGYPLTIHPHWPGFAAAGFSRGITAAVDWG